MAIDRSQNHQVIIGGAIIFALVFLTGLTFFIGDLVQRARPSIEIVVLTDNAATLSKGSPVWIAGNEVGVVSRVGVRGQVSDSAGRIAVHARIPRRYAAHVRSDSEVRITSSRLIGDVVIDILPGSPGARALQNGDTLHMSEAGSVEAVLDRATALNASFHDLFTEMIAAEPASGQSVKLERLSTGLAIAVGQFRELMKSLEGTPLQTLTDPEWQRLLEHVSASGRQLSDALNGAVERARAASHDARPSLERLAARADTISAVLDDMRARVAAGGGGLLIRAQTDSAIIKHLHQAQAQLDSLMAETKRNPLRFWF